MTKRRRILSFLLAVLMVLALAPAGGELGPVAYAVTQEDIDNLKGDAKDLADERAEVKSELADIQSRQASVIEKKNLLDRQITLTEQEIQNTEAQIAGYEVLLSQTAYELEENQREEEVQYDLFCRRARAMEKSGTASYWAVLFQAESFSDLLSRLADIQTVMNYDQSILDGLRQLRAQIQEKQDRQETLKAESEAAKVTLEEKKVDLNTQRQDAEKIIQEMQADVDAYAAELKAIEAEAAKIDKEIKEKEEELE